MKQPTKAQALAALRMAVRNMVYGQQCPFGTVQCGRFQFCGCPKCLEAIVSHFVALAKKGEKNGK